MEVSLGFVCLLFLRMSLCADENQRHQQAPIAESRSLSNRFPLGWLSGIGNWFSNINRAASSIKRKGASDSQSGESSTNLPTKIISPISNFVSEASKTATDAITDLRDRVTNIFASLSDYLVNGIPYAKETSKLPNKHLPEYVKGEELTESNSFAKSLLSRKHDPKKMQKEGRSPEQIYNDFIYRLESDGYYDKYYRIKDLDEQYIKDYEDFLSEKLKKRNFLSRPSPLSALVSLYRKFEETLRTEFYNKENNV